MRARLLPHPLLSLALFVIWLLLVNSISINSIVFAALLGIVVPMITQPYWPDMPTLRNPVAIVGYCLIVLYDIVVANTQVALIVLFKRSADLRPAWVCVPLDIRSPEAITVLAGTITLTPGTVSCDLSEDGRAILVHCLHAPDPSAVSADIKSRYERRLKEIFE
ncbi:Na+/H+ antiporter subunit E [Pararhodobacter sp.]|uniref:Na+/H+ antiporter subunit E n=1 Tax=Pararhodobacter sp. TaxID=2127056 RepID=UPI002AFE17A6|nr:Na+/H+ antiporter subunit E [Pararhodobacter sp.]